MVINSWISYFIVVEKDINFLGLMGISVNNFLTAIQDKKEKTNMNAHIKNGYSNKFLYPFVGEDMALFCS